MSDHLGITETDAAIAIISGAPERVIQLTDSFESPQRLTDHRGFLIYEAWFKNRKILFVSSGIGGPSTAIAIEELIDLGIKIIIRIGTCGAIDPAINVGDIVISSGAIREEGTSKQYVKIEYPAIPDPLLLGLILNAANANEIKYHLGITHCKDAYYLEKPSKQISQKQTKNLWEDWRNANVLATEMETAVLFILGSLRKIMTASMFINIGKYHDKEKYNNALKNILVVLKNTLSFLIDSKLIIVNKKETGSRPEESYLNKDQLIK